MEKRIKELERKVVDLEKCIVLLNETDRDIIDGVNKSFESLLLKFKEIGLIKFER